MQLLTSANRRIMIDMLHSPANILVLGGMNMGLLTRAERVPRAGETLRGQRFYSSPGGKGATQAVAAARLGATVKMVGRVGDDLFGPALLAAVGKHGVDTSDVAVDAQQATGVGVIIVDDSGQNHVLATYGANLQCGEEQLDAVRRSLGDADVLLLQMETPFDLSVQAARLAQEAAVRVILDPAPAAEIAEGVYASFSIVAPNQTEAAYHTGVEVNDVAAAKRAAGVLRGRGVEIAIIKMAELGVYFESPQASGYVRPFEVEAVDTTSAGDAFHGALAVGLAEGTALGEAVRFAAAAGALAVTRPGVQDAMPSRQEVDALIEAAEG